MSEPASEEKTGQQRCIVAIARGARTDVHAKVGEQKSARSGHDGEGVLQDAAVTKNQL